MASVRFTIDGQEITAERGQPLIDAARAADIYIPTLCSHPDLPPATEACAAPQVHRGEEIITSDAPGEHWDGCGLCVVELTGRDELVRACALEVEDGLTIRSSSDRVAAHRRARFATILTEHPHACLTCAQREGCSRTDCSSNVPEAERCCELLGSCELQRVAEFIGVPRDLPRYRPPAGTDRVEEPLVEWNVALCVGCLRCVRACCDLREVGTLGFALQDGQPVVGTVGGPTRSASHCRFCGSCIEVCPTGALRDKTRVPTSERERALVPCRSGCPAGIDVPRFVHHIAHRDFAGAIAVIRERLPFAFAPSYVCFHPCETGCRRGIVNQPISVCRLKRFVADRDTGEWRARQKLLPPTGKSVAVVGSGPAGLTAAYYLAKQGHAVTVLEALAEPGGMLRVGIPTFRYPVTLLERDLDEIRAVGVEIRCGAAVEDGEALAELGREHDAVFVATGAHEAKRIDIAGHDLEGVLGGVEFLRDHALGHIPADRFEGQRVLVVGGGNVAVDAARVALRLHAREVCIASLERMGDLPAFEPEVEQAAEEGIHFLPGWGPRELVNGRGGVSGVVLKRCTRVFDDADRFAPAYDESETREEPVDAVVLAIGQAPSSAPFADCGLSPDGTIHVDDDTLATRQERIFAGGDVVTGPRSVIEAIAAGRRAANEIDRALGGIGDIDECLVEEAPADSRLGVVEEFATLPRSEPGEVTPEERIDSFALIERGFDEVQAIAEASRCLRCDLRLDIAAAPLAPTADDVLPLCAESVAGIPEVEGVYQLLDEDRGVLAIRGVMNLREALTEQLEENESACFFIYECEPMYSRRESELIQRYVQEHGELPGGGEDELDDLF